MDLKQGCSAEDGVGSLKPSSFAPNLTIPHPTPEGFCIDQFPGLCEQCVLVQACMPIRGRVERKAILLFIKM